MQPMDDGANLDITGNYDLCVRIFVVLEKRLKVSIKLHQDQARAGDGQIFLFNHFARFETIIPQYLIHRETGAYCRSVASSEFFGEEDDRFTKFLYSVGAVPNDHPHLLSFLAAEILRGRKVVVFPEGGMIKDRKVLDEEGRYSIFSPTSETQRKHHRGAAVIALTLEAFKKRILSVHAAGEEARLQRWVKALDLDGTETLLAAARQPTTIIPANITFYPIRITDNILRKGMELFSKGIGKRFVEELLIEGNILLKDTDMDIRLGTAIPPNIKWHWWERFLLNQVFRRVNSLDDLFSLRRDAPEWDERLFARYMRRQTMRLRDSAMEAMYGGVTVNLSHIASRLIMGLIDREQTEVSKEF
ncbi:MAG: alpha/beta hydrolase, partial [Rhodospirillales bacterium]|nr:alpha/beta hydrolase [Rhodospirillales bacterium]